MSPRDAPDRGGWATAPQDTRERTCEYTGSPVFSVFHGLRVARAPDPETTTVTRTYEATVEWTTRRTLPEWLVAVAETCTPYDADRFDRPTVAGGGDGNDGDAEGDDGHPEKTPADDGRFRAAPADATVRPPTDPDPALTDPYHYWNTPLGRIQRDECYPGSVASLTVDLVGGPDAVWTGESTAGPPVEHLPEDRGSYARVGLEFVGRQRVRTRETGRDRPAPSSDVGDPPRPSTGPDDWQPIGTDDDPATDPLEELVEATLAPALRDRPVQAAVREVLAQIEAVSTVFEWGDGEPYEIPASAVDAATSPPG